MAPPQGQLAAKIVARSMQNVLSSPASEHISLETQNDHTGPQKTLPDKRKVIERFELRSRLRGVSTDLRILHDYFLAVQTARPGSESRDYLVDLRFTKAQPTRTREIAWLWLGVCSALFVGAAGSLWWAARSGEPVLSHSGFGVALGSLACSAAALVMFFRGTSESLRFTSVHGNAIFVDIVGGIGSHRAGKKFFVTLIKHITLAKNAAAQQKQHYLRDEMREHSRLREQGVLSDDDYELSKMRILSAHD
jgi:hypothetical protein